MGQVHIVARPFHYLESPIGDEGDGRRGDGDGNSSVALPPHESYRTLEATQLILIALIDHLHENAAHHSAGSSIIVRSKSAPRSLQSLLRNQADLPSPSQQPEPSRWFRHWRASTNKRYSRQNESRDRVWTRSSQRDCYPTAERMAYHHRRNSELAKNGFDQLRISGCSDRFVRGRRGTESGKVESNRLITAQKSVEIGAGTAPTMQREDVRRKAAVPCSEE